MWEMALTFAWSTTVHFWSRHQSNTEKESVTREPVSPKVPFQTWEFRAPLNAKQLHDPLVSESLFSRLVWIRSRMLNEPPRTASNTFSLIFLPFHTMLLSRKAQRTLRVVTKIWKSKRHCRHKKFDTILIVPAIYLIQAKKLPQPNSKRKNRGRRDTKSSQIKFLPFLTLHSELERSSLRIQFNWIQCNHLRKMSLIICCFVCII